MNRFLLSSFRLMAFVLFLSSALGAEDSSAAVAAAQDAAPIAAAAR
jgi:hypothetical protein